MKTYMSLAATIVVVCLLVAVGPVAAQRNAGAAAETEYKAVQVLLVARHLQLTEEQVKAIMPLATELAEAKKALTEELDKLQEAGAKTLEEATAALLSGQPMSAATQQAAEATVAGYHKAQETYEQKVIAAADKVLQLLTANQRALIETPEETAEREAQALTATGGPTVDYVVDHLVMIRDVPPADYRTVRALVARDLAMQMGAALELEQEDLPALTAIVLEVMDQVMMMSDAEFADLRPQLAEEVIAYFELPEDAAAGPPPARLTLRQLDGFLANPATAKLLGDMQFAPAQVPAPPMYGLGNPELELGARRLWETTDDRHKLEQSLDLIDIVSVMGDLQIASNQAAALQPQVAELREDYAEEQKAWRDALVKQRSDLGKIRETLQRNQALSDQQSDVLAELSRTEADGALAVLKVANEVIGTVREVLDESQIRAVDWRPPVCLAQSEPVEEKLERLLELSGQIGDMARLLEEVRRIEPIAYQSNAGAMTEQFLRRYMPPQAPGFEQAVRYLIEVQMRAREVPQDQWDEGTAALLSINAMIGLGLLPEDVLPGAAMPANPDALYNWWDLEQILSDPLTDSIIRIMTRPGQPGRAGG